MICPVQLSSTRDDVCRRVMGDRRNHSILQAPFTSKPHTIEPGSDAQSKDRCATPTSCWPGAPSVLLLAVHRPAPSVVKCRSCLEELESPPAWGVGQQQVELAKQIFDCSHQDGSPT